MQHSTLGLFLTALFAVAAPAHAGLVGSPAAVELRAPGGYLSTSGPVTQPIDALDTFGSLTAGQQILPDLLDPVGQWMQPAESITVFDSSVQVVAASGFQLGPAFPLTTGWAAGTEYLFSGLSPSAGGVRQILTGVSLSVLPGEISNFDPAWAKLVSPTSFSLDLASMTFIQGANVGNSLAVGDFTIQLSFGVAPVAEPSTEALLLAGLGALALLARRRSA